MNVITSEKSYYMWVKLLQIRKVSQVRKVIKSKESYSK